MSVNGKFTGVTRNDLLKVADRFQIGTAQHVLKQVGQAVKEWSAFAEEAHVSPVERDRIRAYHQVL
jgi:serine/threonine-protein kinase HipA